MNTVDIPGIISCQKNHPPYLLKRQLQWMKASGMRVKTVRCDNAKEQMAPLKDMCWENGVLVEYVAPYGEKRRENSLRI
jgi:hypothetical protein